MLSLASRQCAPLYPLRTAACVGLEICDEMRRSRGRATWITPFEAEIRIHAHDCLVTHHGTGVLRAFWRVNNWRQLEWDKMAHLDEELSVAVLIH